MPDTPAKPTGTALIVSQDKGDIDRLIAPLQQFAISLRVCPEVQEAMDLVRQRKFEAVIVDFAFGYQAVSLLHQVRESPSNRTAVTFAITSGPEEATLALQRGTHFLLERPLSVETLTHTIRAAYGSILRERRRYFRYPIAVPVLLRRPEDLQIPGQTVNISERGMAVKTSVPLDAGSEANVQFMLPDLAIPITTDAKVCWSNEYGHSGLQFTALSSATASKLSAWLAVRLEEQLPKNVTEKFGSPTEL